MRSLDVPSITTVKSARRSAMAWDSSCLQRIVCLSHLVPSFEQVGLDRINGNWVYGTRQCSHTDSNENQQMQK